MRPGERLGIRSSAAFSRSDRIVWYSECAYRATAYGLQGKGSLEVPGGFRQGRCESVHAAGAVGDRQGLTAKLHRRPTARTAPAGQPDL